MDSAPAQGLAQQPRQGGLIARLLREFISFAGWKSANMILLMLLVAGLEGAGLMLLAPMLELAGVTGSAHAGPASRVMSVFVALGLTPSLTMVLCLYLALIAVHSVLSWKMSTLTSELQLGFVDRLRQRLFDGIGAAEWAFMARTHSSEFSHALTVDIGRIQDAVYSSLQILTTAIMTLGYAATAFYLSPALTIGTIGTGGVLLLFLRRHHRNSYKLGEGLTASTQRVHENIGEYLAGLKLAKSGNVQARLSARFSEDMHEARDSSVAFMRRYSVSRGLFRVGGAAVLCVFVYVSLVLAAIPVATVLALAFIFTRLFPYLSQIQQSYELLMHALPAYHSYSTMCVRCEQEAEPAAEDRPYVFSREIVFKQVGYRPDTSDGDIVTEINLAIPVYSTTALIGPSGAGKSTLADLLAGLLAPTAGSIMVDDRELTDRRAWRERVAYVPQETFLFNTSVRENLLWTTPEANDEMLWDALEHAAAAEFVRALPQGLDTVLGERGIRLSGGERQRLAIARALLRKPFLLVLDEATSALDRDNEIHIQTTLSKLHRQLTILLIAHRPATIMCADRVATLQNGRLVKTEMQTVS